VHRVFENGFANSARQGECVVIGHERISIALDDTGERGDTGVMAARGSGRIEGHAERRQDGRNPRRVWNDQYPAGIQKYGLNAHGADDIAGSTR
jgi:hypothetical protein